MKKKISTINIIGSLLFSIIAIPAITISLFTFPIELIVFDPASYYPVLDEQLYKEDFPVLVSEIISGQLITLGSSDNKETIKTQENLSVIISKYLPSEWLEEMAIGLIDNTVAFFNFKNPYNLIEINIQELKSSILDNSSSIAEEYVLSLVNCTEAENEMFSDNEYFEIDPLTMCKPSNDNIDRVSEALTVYFQDLTNQLPATINVLGIIPSQMVSGEKFFYFYSITRWSFRLLPFLVLLILILIAQLLKGNKKIMRKWVGLILTIIPAAVLLTLVILLIGFNQFIGLLFKQKFSNIIPAFGRILIWIIQNVGNYVILWVTGIAAAVLLFGLILLFISRFTKVEQIADPGTGAFESSQPEQISEKEIMPETLEEIEKREAKIEKVKKK